MKALSIMVVDDEEGIRELIHDVLEQQGHKVICAENGIEAISMLSSHPVDVVYLDIRMPNGDGLTALKKMQEMWPSMPVIMITGCGQREAIDEAIDLGSFACLIKPFSTRDILGMLDAVQIAGA